MEGTAKRVVVAMSGGVDSSVVAALIVREGWETIGATLEMRVSEKDMSPSCSSVDAITGAQAVAKQLGIPHHVIRCGEAFETKVLRPAWRDYAEGRTPSPCLLCNREIKFGELLAFAECMGASFLATGHYARILREGNTIALLRGSDRAKDQSYFLSQLDYAQIRRMLLPLGTMAKSDVRVLARSLGLSTAERPDSQDACIADEALGLAETLRQRYGASVPEGRFITPQGRDLGPHQGLHRYTIGQRRGVGVALGAPAPVVEIRSEDGAVVLSTDPKDLLASGLVATELRWHDTIPVRCEVQIRSRHRAAPARIEIDDRGKLLVYFDELQNSVTPGQAVAFYDGDRVLGGGWIERALK